MYMYGKIFETHGNMWSGNNNNSNSGLCYNITASIYLLDKKYYEAAYYYLEAADQFSKIDNNKETISNLEKSLEILNNNYNSKDDGLIAIVTEKLADAITNNSKKLDLYNSAIIYNSRLRNNNVCMRVINKKINLMCINQEYKSTYEFIKTFIVKCEQKYYLPIFLSMGILTFYLYPNSDKFISYLEDNIEYTNAHEYEFLFQLSDVSEKSDIFNIITNYNKSYGLLRWQHLLLMTLLKK